MNRGAVGAIAALPGAGGVILTQWGGVWFREQYGQEFDPDFTEEVERRQALLAASR